MGLCRVLITIVMFAFLRLHATHLSPPRHCWARPDFQQRCSSFLFESISGLELSQPPAPTLEQKLQ
ncbi:hypothetical protein BIFGAL_03149 [Bifidobacterium gallicum DSM 20093 = LMG 11596]|uniref:Uncharacterized protein n=1 Tax=Bifidobacterium gallicum DSM 20093 = LMG 11596 TaxID=561180 RepID=D1NTJ0_9BIFI|nr:hypothetical protein BIFGAL_03149 [Bifidobacterium gallicum DSM 20093 = LMG 11596]